MTKRFLAVILASIFVIVPLASCNSQTNKGEVKKTIITTVFPIYDWVKNIVGTSEKINVVLLNETGIDLHSYQATAKDLLLMTISDMIIFIGGESESWIYDQIKTQNRDDVALLKLMGDLAKEEEIKEGMQGEEEEEEEDEEEGEIEYDEHIWLSLKNAKYLVEKICDKICELEPTNKETYKSNRDAYLNKLTELDDKYESALSKYNNKCAIVTDRMPFRYLFDDYDIDYYAAFVGCSAETEASFETIVFLSNKVKETNAKAVLKIDGGSDKIAKTVIDTAKVENVKILTLVSLQSVSKEQLDNGITYLKVMEDNLNVLKEVF